MQTLQAILISRRIYQPEGVEYVLLEFRFYSNRACRMTADKYLELNRRFVESYLNFQHEPQVQAVMKKALAYLAKLHTWGLRDQQVVTLPPLSTGDRCENPLLIFFFFFFLLTHLQIHFVAWKSNNSCSTATVRLAWSNIEFASRNCSSYARQQTR